MRKILQMAKVPQKKSPVRTAFSREDFDRFLRDEKRFSRYSAKNHVTRAVYIKRHFGVIRPTLEDAGRIRMALEERRLSSAMVKHCLRTCELMAEYQGRPFKIAKPRQVYRLPDVLDAKEARRLIDAAENLRDRAILCVLLYCGLRSKELCELRLGDVDLSGRVLWIRDHGEGIKNRHERRALMSREAAGALREWMEARPFVRDNGYVFITETGKPLYKDRLNRILYDAARRARITKRVHAHQLRHTCGSNMIRAGVPITEVQLQLGHRSLSSTLIYLHGNIEDLRESVDKRFKY